jgi:hypothetical protein
MHGVGLMSEFEISRQPTTYLIKLNGHLDERWSTWFNGLIVTHNDNLQISIIRGQIPDQAKLRGVLNKIWDLNLEIISLNRLEDKF